MPGAGRPRGGRREYQFQAVKDFASPMCHAEIFPGRIIGKTVALIDQRVALPEFF